MKKLSRLVTILTVWAVVLAPVWFPSTIFAAVDGDSADQAPSTSVFTGETSDAAELPCAGTRYELATASYVGQGTAPGSGRAIGFQADTDFTITSVGISAALLYESYDVVIYDSPDGHSAGGVLYATSGMTGGGGYGWHDIAATFSFNAGQYYVMNWRPTDGGHSDWVEAPGMDYYYDSGLPYTTGPITIVEGFEGFDAENVANAFHPFMRFCVEVQQCDYCFEDSAGYVWCLNLIGSDSAGYYLAGTVNMGYETRDAVATYLKSNSGVSFTGAAGSGVPFNYNWKYQSGSGVWINVSEYAGHGLISVWLCGTAGGELAADDASAPGVE